MIKHSCQIIIAYHAASFCYWFQLCRFIVVILVCDIAVNDVG